MVRKIRMTAEELTAHAKAGASSEQLAMMEKLMAVTWTVWETHGLYDHPNLLIILTAPNRCIGALYPDGTFTRNKAGQKSIKLNYRWKQKGDWTF